jgi:amidohydrolase
VTKVADTGAVVRIGPEGPAIGLRGEMDALPISERTGVPWASRHGGVMHACAHDVHLAALVAVAHAIFDCGTPVPLVLVFQPREETYPSGALEIAEHGVLRDEHCEMIIGAHVQPSLDAGVVACVAGSVNASSDEFRILVEGEPGHAAYPHLTNDPLLALAEIVVSLQSVVSRGVDPLSAAVVGVSSFSSGAAANVVPGSAVATGTIRALSTSTREILHERITGIARNVARAHDCRAEVAITHGEPVLHNDPGLTAATARHLRDTELELCDDLRSLGSDDFSFFSEVMPGLMMFIGSSSNERLHSPTFLPSGDEVRATAAALLAGYLGARDLLEKRAT